MYESALFVVPIVMIVLGILTFVLWQEFTEVRKARRSDLLKLPDAVTESSAPQLRQVLKSEVLRAERGNSFKGS